ncbi:Mg2+ transport protein [Spiroplasma helicoides]|uniref:Magnesium transporter MgtE n=1 Tax=Spiroplasma helicoides TaxID=216938 RepID=A0A1B3SJF6_9MOLU|nr:magnesium transporter [Spiroplasma helicoides]AOG60050.1 Mg2+ transport protein [Spiroplasma helicoides]
MKKKLLSPQELAEKLEKILKNSDVDLFRKMVNDYYPADLAEALSEFPLERLIIALRILSTDQMAEIFTFFTNDIQEEIIKSYSSKEIKELFDNIFTDDIVDILEELPSNLVKKVLRSTTPESRLQINSILKYADYTAGSIMSVDYTKLLLTSTVKEAIELIKKERDESEEVYFFYVVDDLNNLKGVVELKKLIFSSRDALIKDIMEDRIILANTTTDQEEVVNIFKKYDITTLPIINSQNKLVGIITVDDVLDVLEEETTEDIHKMAGIAPTEEEYFKTSVWKMVKSRGIGLLFLMLFATISQVIILLFMSLYELNSEEKNVYQNGWSINYIVTILLIPLLTVIYGTSGFARSQSATMVVRALSLSEVYSKDILKIIWKELRVALITGIILVGVNFLRLIIIYSVQYKGDINHKELWYALATVSITIFLTVIFSKLIGSTLPVIAKKIKMDPATMASPIISTVVDGISTALFFSIGYVFYAYLLVA